MEDNDFPDDNDVSKYRIYNNDNYYIYNDKGYISEDNESK